MKHLDLKFQILKEFPTQADFAMAAKEHESKVSQVIRGRRQLSKGEAKRWSKLLNCDPQLLKSVTR